MAATLEAKQSTLSDVNSPSFRRAESPPVHPQNTPIYAPLLFFHPTFKWERDEGSDDRENEAKR